MRFHPLGPALALAIAAITVSGCSKSGSSSSSSAASGGPTNAQHLTHLRGGTMAGGLGCTDCHSARGFSVDFSQSTVPHVAGQASFDPTTQTCSSVMCHGSFDLNGIRGKSDPVRWTAGAPVDCGSCHGMPPTGHVAVYGAPDPTSCSLCHPDTVNRDGTINLASGRHLNGLADVNGGACTSCHGDGTRVPGLPGTDALLASAPPAAPAASAPSVVGAHQAHMNPSPLTAMAAPVACAECHPIPGDAAHATTPPPARVTFGTLASANGAAPAWNQATGGCSASYCHGNFSYSGVSGTVASITWTSVTHLDCTSCHAMPPTGHIAVANAPAASSCAPCHPTSISPDGTVNLAGGTHLDGKADVAALGCTACHGDSTRAPRQAGTDANLVSAPPVAPAGAPTYAVGVHEGHVNPPATGAFSGPIACVVCHPPTTDLRHATSPPPSSVVFSGVALADGAAPTWTVSSTGCAATYCHGSFSYNGVSGSAAAVSWTDTTPLTCTSCHGMPPTGHVAVSGAPAASSCAACHPNAVNPDGTINLAAGGHLNGRPDTSAVGCTACHGDASRTGNLPGTDVNLISSPPVAPASAPAYATGAHLGHVNPSAGTALMPPIACGACHVVPGDAQHAFRPPANGVVFSGLALTGGAAAAWNAGTAGCSASYCHGNFNYNGVTGTNATVLWTSTALLDCTACHGMPPAGHVAVPGAPAPASCNPCHSQTVSAAGVVSRTYHMNGKAEGGDCGSCHGLPPATNRHTESDHRRASCDACHPTGYNSSTIVARFHNNGVTDIGAQAGYSCGLTGCPTVPNGTCTNSCHGASKGAWNSR